MAKTRDFPHELRHFVKALNSFHGYWHDYDIFRDFIDYAAASLLWEGDKELADRLKRHYKNDYPRFGEMFHALVSTMHDNLGEDLDWYDALGTLYEEISSNSKASFLGQYFTPKPICDMMAQIQAPEKGRTDLKVNDPACGSGRMLLAFNKLAPGNYLVGQDKDAICTKMTAINLALHGCKGQSVNGDSLMPDDFHFGYEVNPFIHLTNGLPNLKLISKFESVAWQVWESKKQEVKSINGNPNKEVEQKPAIMEQVIPGLQLTLF